MHFKEVSSTVDFIRESYTASMEMLFEGALLAVIVVWMFLRDWRATLISAAALPLAIIPTFWAMHLLGYTLNLLTLLALSLVVGMLVDDAIVEVENIVRHLRNGQEAARGGDRRRDRDRPRSGRDDADAVRGVRAGRVHGRHARRVLPAVRLHRRRRRDVLAAGRAHAHADDGRVHAEAARGAERGQLRSSASISCAIEWCLGHRRKTLAVATALLVASFALIPFIPKGFAPAGDVGFAVLQVELPPGAALEETTQVAETIRARVDADPERRRACTASSAPLQAAAVRAGQATRSATCVAPT